MLFRSLHLAHVAGAGRGHIEPGHAVHQGGLARPRGPHHRGEPAAAEGDVDAVEGAHLGGALSVGLDEADGAGGRPPFLAYVELNVQSSTANKDGWMLVRRIPRGKTWFPLNDNLSGAGFNTDENGFVDSLAGTPLTPTGSKPASLQFDYLLRADTEFMFAAVNATSDDDGKPKLWCVITRGADGRFGGSLNSALKTTAVLVYTRKTTSTTNVLFGALYGAPFIGCEGSFSANQSWMLYGEDGATSYNSLLNSI